MYGDAGPEARKGLYCRRSIVWPGWPSWRQRRQGKEVGDVTGRWRVVWEGFRLEVGRSRGVGRGVNFSILVMVDKRLVGGAR